jgi:hypothetical protein
MVFVSMIHAPMFNAHRVLFAIRGNANQIHAEISHVKPGACAIPPPPVASTTLVPVSNAQTSSSAVMANA